MAKGIKRHPYRYTQLTEKSCIRLLKLLPGKANQKIQRHLRPISLRELPSYEAISYVWSSRRERTRIPCHGNLLRFR